MDHGHGCQPLKHKEFQVRSFSNDFIHWLILQIAAPSRRHRKHHTHSATIGANEVNDRDAIHPYLYMSGTNFTAGWNRWHISTGIQAMTQTNTCSLPLECMYMVSNCHWLISDYIWDLLLWNYNTSMSNIGDITLKFTIPPMSMTLPEVSPLVHCWWHH